MSIEHSILLLRLLAALSLLAFLLALFIVIWRGFKGVEMGAAFGTAKRGYLLREQAAQDDEAERWSLRPIMTLGRAGSNAIIVDDDYASAEHARILLENGNWWLEDRKSRNGTRLNDERIAGRAILADGDVIGIGQVRFRVQLAS